MPEKEVAKDARLDGREDVADREEVQPGRPAPSGVSQVGSPGLGRFNSAKSPL
jgi:hypothetical protein